MSQDAMNEPGIDVLAIAAHRDDVEQTCGGTLLRMASRGLRTGHSRLNARRGRDAG